MEKFRHECAYCGGETKDPVLEVEHAVPKSRHGTDRVSNLAIACRTCNQAKDDLTLPEWLEALAASGRPVDRTRASRIPQALAQLKRPLRDAAVMNATRWAVHGALQATGLPLEAGSGGRTKFNRMKLGLAKEHCLDAVCVGASTPRRLEFAPGRLAALKVLGRGHRRMANVDRHGFPKGHRLRSKSVHGFRTGDLVRAEVASGKL